MWHTSIANCNCCDGGVSRNVEEIVVGNVMEIHECIVVLHNKNCKELAVIKHQSEYHDMIDHREAHL